MRTRLLALALCCATPSLANDTMAELGNGGLVFVNSDMVEMEREDLYISPLEVRVAYVFRSRSDEDIETLVAFPMPEIKGDPEVAVAVPDAGDDNMMHFEVEIDGRSLAPRLEQRAFAVTLDITADLRAAGVPLNPFSPAAAEAVAALAQEVKDDWTVRGILYREVSGENGDMAATYLPYWSMRSTYWWRMVFPANGRVEVRHRYEPSVGGAGGVLFFQDGRPVEPDHQRYRAKYCLDEPFMNAVRRIARQNGGNLPHVETWMSYVLTTGANWTGSIGEFTLTVDKLDQRNLVSFCGENVRKVGPTTFETKVKDFYPERDLDILLLQPLDTAE